MVTKPPLDVRIVPAEIDSKTVRSLVFVGIMSIAPVAIAILMQKASLRQSIIMHASHYGGEICSAQSELWASAAARCKQAYNVARM